MAESKRLAAHRAAVLAAGESEQEVPQPDKEPEEDELNPTKPKEPAVADENEQKAAVDAARTEGFKAANERMTNVFASEHYAGREALAAKMLGKASMTAEDIIDVLADTPKAKTAADLSEEQLLAAAEEGGRQEMKAELEKNKNSGIDPDGGGKPDARAQAESVWDRAAKANRREEK